MSQKLLGLDIGSYSIKAALFETTFRAFELTDLFESAPLQADELAPEERMVVVREAILRMIQEHSLAPSGVITALPGNLVSTRVVTMPLPPRQIERVLPFELEPNLPFDLEEVLIDHHVISGSNTETTCLAAAVRKTVMADHLTLLRGAGLEPAFVGLDSLTLYNLNQMDLASETGTYAIVDIGHQKTSICIVSDGAVQMVRTLFTAGQAITSSIREDLDLTLDQAIEVKHSHGIVELDNQPLRSADLKKLSAAVRKAIDPLLQEILQTFQAYRASKGNDNPIDVENVYLCGGSSLLRNLPEYMSAVLSRPVHPIQFFPDGNEVSERLGRRQPILAQAVALGLRAAARGPNAKRVSSLNFRKGEFSFAQDLTDLKEKAIFFAKWATAVFVLAFLHMGLRYENLARQNARAEASVMRVFSEIAPDVKTPPKRSSDALKILEDRIRSYRQKQEVLTAGLNDMTALGILREISALIPPDIPLDTQEMTINRNSVTLRGNTDSFASVDRIISALQMQTKFRKIDKGDIRESPDGKKTFQLIVTVGEEETTTEKKKS